MSGTAAVTRAEELVIRMLRRCTPPRKLPPSALRPGTRPEYRAVFISDLHLGMRACQVDRLCRFLRTASSERLYLVGDVIDLLALERSGRVRGDILPVVRLLHRMARRGTRIILIPGNHDALLRRHAGRVEGELYHEIIHQDAKGRRLLVTHGDEADAVVTLHPLLARIGSALYDAALDVSRGVNAVRHGMGLPYWNLAGAVKRAVKLACTYIGDWEATMATRVHSHGLDGVICGHIHVPRIGEIQGRAYYNCGDWVEHASALVETWEGEFRLVTADDAVQSGLAPLPRLRFNLAFPVRLAVRRAFRYRSASLWLRIPFRLNRYSLYRGRGLPGGRIPQELLWIRKKVP